MRELFSQCLRTQLKRMQVLITSSTTTLALDVNARRSPIIDVCVCVHGTTYNVCYVAATIFILLGHKNVPR